MSKKQDQNSFIFSDAEMAPVSKSFLFDGMTLPANLYVRISPNSYLLIGKKSDQAKFKDLKSFAHENFKVYIQESERFLMTNFIMNLTEKTVKNPNVSFSQNQKFIDGLIEEAFEDLTGPLGNLKQLQGVSKIVLELSRQPGIFEKAFELLSHQDESTCKHAMMTCFLSLVLAEQTGMLNNLNQEKLALGALLHDFGLKGVAPSILKKTRAEWTTEEKAEYEKHPILGAEMLRSVPGMSVEVLLIVAEHQETSKGTGYPKGLRDVRINPLSKIVGLAAMFCELTFPQSGAVFAPDEAIAYIENVLDQPYNRTLFSCLKTLVNQEYLAKKIAKQKAS